jgi:hypothetical protein
MDFVENILTVWKPFESSPGWVYIYTRQSDVEKLKEGKITHILLHKIGLTVNLPKDRVKT